LVKALFA